MSAPGRSGGGRKFQLLHRGCNYTGSFLEPDACRRFRPGSSGTPANLLSDGSITVIEHRLRRPSSFGIRKASPSPRARRAVSAPWPRASRPLVYQWQKNGQPIPSRNHQPATPSPAASTNDTGGLHRRGDQLYGSVTSLRRYAHESSRGVPTTVTNGLQVYLNFDNNINAQAGTTNHGALYTGGATQRPALHGRHDRLSGHFRQHLHRRSTG